MGVTGQEQIEPGVCRLAINFRRAGDFRFMSQVAARGTLYWTAPTAGSLMQIKDDFLKIIYVLDPM